MLKRGLLKVKGQVQGHNTCGYLADLEAAVSTAPHGRGSFKVHKRGGEQDTGQGDTQKGLRVSLPLAWAWPAQLPHFLAAGGLR